MWLGFGRGGVVFHIFLLKAQFQEFLVQVVFGFHISPMMCEACLSRRLLFVLSVFVCLFCIIPRGLSKNVPGLFDRLRLKSGSLAVSCQKHDFSEAQTVRPQVVVLLALVLKRASSK